MSLFEKGLIHLSDEVEKFIPEWKNMKVYESGDKNNFKTKSPNRKMLIHDLLTHRSGLTYHFTNETPVDEMYRDKGIMIAQGDKLDPDEYIKLLADIPLEFSPGEHFNYSISTDILGFIIQRITNKTLFEFFKETILDPLNMNDTFFTIPKEKKERFASCYVCDAKNGGYKLSDDSQSSAFSNTPKSFSGGGGLLSTIDDYMKFCNMLQNKGTINGATILGKKTTELMMSNQLEKNVDLSQIAKGRWSETLFEGIGFSLGGSVVIDPVRNKNISSLGEFAWGGAAGTAFWIDPVEKINVVFMTQIMDFLERDALRSELRTVVNQSIV
jgi:CubicO group peptidase (beta-lactamase class C family)